MAEFSLRRDEFSHALQTDGTIQTTETTGGDVTISRFGIFSFYRFNALCPAGYRCRISAQPRSEIRLVFVTKGQEIHSGCADEVRVFSVNESNCSFVKRGCTQDFVVHGDAPSELFVLIVGVSDISLPMAGFQSNLRDFLATNRCAWLLPGRNMLLGMRKTIVFQQLLHEKKPAYLQAAYTQLKLAELVVLFLEKADRFDSKGAMAQLRPDELERIRNVRNMLHDHPAESYSLVGLAHAVGTNEATLKKNFKAVYGTTVFAYLTACRMEKAKTLLAEGHLKVSAVAQEVGYKYASHFSSAFRKHFGHLPTKLLQLLVAFPVCLSGAAYMEARTYLMLL